MGLKNIFELKIPETSISTENATAGFQLTVVNGQAQWAAPSPIGGIPLTAAHILVGNGSNAAADVAVSGDLTLASSGAFTVVRAPAGTLTGATLAANVLASSLTSVGTLSSLTTAGTVNLNSGLYVRNTTASTVAIGLSNPNTNTCFDVRALSGLIGATQYGIISQPVFTSAVTTKGVGILAYCATAASAFTMTSAISLAVEGIGVGAGSTVTTAYGLKIENITGGSTNYAIHTGTGLVSLGGALSLSASNTVSAAVATPSTHKAMIVIGGTTYYALLTTVP